MGCMQVRVKPDLSVDQNESKTNASQVKIIRNLPDELDKSTTSLLMTNSTPVTMLESLMVSPVVSMKSEDLLVESRTLIRSSKSNDNRNNGISEAVNDFNVSTSRQNTFTSPIHRINIPNTDDMISNVSEIPAVSSMSIASGEINQSSSVHSFVITSSSDLEQKTFRQDAIKRFSSVGLKRPNSHQTSTKDNFGSESDESYSFRDSFLSSVSADAEESTSDRVTGIRTTFIQPKKSNIQHRIVADVNYSESDESHLTRTNSDFGDVKMMTDRLVTGLRLRSSRLSNSDCPSKQFISETTSESY